MKKTSTELTGDGAMSAENASSREMECPLDQVQAIIHDLAEDKLAQEERAQKERAQKERAQKAQNEERGCAESSAPAHGLDGIVDPLLQSKILIIDDVIENVQVAKLHLEAAGYTHIEFEQYPENVIARLQNDSPALVLMDVRMPEFTGIELLQKIREIPSLVDLPVVFLTGTTDQETKRKTLAMGANGFLRKPIERQELTLTIQNVLAARAFYAQLKKNHKQNQQPNKTQNQQQNLKQAPKQISSASTNRSRGPAIAPKVPANHPNQDGCIESIYAADPGFIPILSNFVARLETEVSVMRALFNSDHTVELISAAHSLKGTSGNLGFEPLFDALSKFEQSLKSNDMPAASEQLQAVEALAKRVR